MQGCTLTFFHALLLTASYDVADNQNYIQHKQEGAGCRYGDDDDLWRIATSQEEVSVHGVFVIGAWKRATRSAQTLNMQIGRHTCDRQKQLINEWVKWIGLRLQMVEEQKKWSS